MGISYTNYGTLAGAITYFASRLHSDPWDEASADDRNRALLAATRVIDTLNYKGDKNAVYVAKLADPEITDAAIREAEASQPHEFPRGSDTSVPAAIEQANYEIALALLDGRDPDIELEAMGISSQGIESVRTTYARNQVPVEHLINGVSSALAWRLLRPFLRDDDAVKLIRV
jgi:P2-related tail formation protein